MRLIVFVAALSLLTASCSDSEAPQSSQDTGDPAPTETTGASDDSVTGGFAAISPIVSAFVDSQGLNGAGIAIVHRDHGIMHEEYWGEFGPDHVSLIASSSKMIAAGVLLRLHEDGALDLDAPVSAVVDWGSGNPDVTPAQLISNSSGLVGLLPNPGYSPYLCQWDHEGSLGECGEAIFTTADDDGDIAAPDTEFRYGGAQWQVAGAVAEAASGKTWAELINEIYIEPCGLGTLGFTSPTAFGRGDFSYPSGFDGDLSVLPESANPNIEGGGYVTVPDYAALLLMHLRDGNCGDNQVLSPESLARAHGDRIAEVYEGEAWSSDDGYGMGWWISRVSDRITDGGAFGTQVWLDLDDGYGVYLVIEATSQKGQALSAQLYDIIEAAVVG